MTMQLLWGIAIGLLVGSLIQLGCDLMGRKAGTRCGFDCRKCQVGKKGCAGYYCYLARQNADIAAEGE